MNVATDIEITERRDGPKGVLFDLKNSHMSCWYRLRGTLGSSAPAAQDDRPLRSLSIVVSGRQANHRRSLITVLQAQGAQVQGALNLSSAAALMAAEARTTAFVKVVINMSEDGERLDDADFETLKASGIGRAIVCQTSADDLGTEGGFDDIINVLKQTHTAAHQPRVLVIDDNTMNRRMAAKQLARLGVAVDEAKDGHAALALLEADPYDLVFVDCLMPVIDGFEFTEMLRAREKDSDRRLPVIALTGREPSRVEQRCREVGMDGLISKPLNLAEAISTLDTWLDGRGMTFKDLSPQKPPEPVDAAPMNIDAPIDRAEITRILGRGDSQSALALLDQFATAFVPLLARLADALEIADSAALEDAAHAAKGVAASAAAAELTRLMAELESGAADFDFSAGPATMKVVHAEFDKIGIYISQLKNAERVKSAERKQ